MISKVLRIAVLVVVTLSIVSCGHAQPAAQAPLSASPAPVDALVQIAAVATSAASADAGIPATTAAVVLSQPPKSSGALIPSSWRQPGGSDEIDCLGFCLFFF